MSLYILDTDHVTLHQRGDPRVIDRLTTPPSVDVAVTVITVEEQWRGRLALIGRKTVSLALAYRQLLATAEYFCHWTVLPFDEPAQEQYRLLREQAIRIGTLDLRIAAIALALGATLVTRNRRDFEKVPGIKLEDWSR